MRVKHLMLPMLAIAIGAVLLTTQHREIQRLQYDNTRIRTLITTASGSCPHPRSSPSRSNEPANLKKLAYLVRDHPRDHPIGLIAYQRQLLTMEATALLSMLDELAAMDLDDASRHRLESLILDPLSKKDPEVALNRFKASLRGPQNLQTAILSHSMDGWAKEDLAAATAWLDREIAAGSFDPKSLDANNPLLARFEASVLFHQVSTDPAGVKARLAAYPIAMQIDILMLQADRLNRLRPQDQTVFAAMAREVAEQIPDATQRDRLLGKFGSTPP
jgi:hypothetical protein